jgi:hypothetical protein
MQLQKIGKEIWVYDGSRVSFYGFPFSTRMTVIRLQNGNLWVHSPEKINADLITELLALGKVKYLISPNKLHHLFLAEWIEQFPDAITYAAPGLCKKRKDINFDNELTDTPDHAWESEIDQTLFQGSHTMVEVVFFHMASRTLILTDLIENFDPATLNWWQTKLARFAGILNPSGKTPIDWRLSFHLGSMAKATESLSKLLQWQPDNIILSHGVCVFGGGTEFLRSSFSWLMKSSKSL